MRAGILTPVFTERQKLVILQVSNLTLPEDLLDRLCPYKKDEDLGHFTDYINTVIYNYLLLVLKLFNNEFIHIVNLKSNPIRVHLLYLYRSDGICFLQDCLTLSPVKLVANIRVDLIHSKMKMRQK